jgi:hypothetical protein
MFLKRSCEVEYERFEDYSGLAFPMVQNSFRKLAVCIRQFWQEVIFCVINTYGKQLFLANKCF